MRLVTALFALLLGTSAQAAVTYTYTGNTFTDIIDDGDPAHCATAIHYTCRGYYTTDMRVTITMVLDDYLAPDTDYSLTALPNVLVLGIGVDGNLASAFPPHLMTDAAGQIASWRFIFKQGTIGGDGDLIESDSSSGDRAEFTSEYAWYEGIDPNHPYRPASEGSHARVGAPGVWTVDPSPVPLPAGGWLLASCLPVSLAGMRRARCR